MSRFEGEFQVASGRPIALPELLKLLEDATLPAQQRHAAIACYLSGSDGWRDAGRLLGGAFADESQPDASDGKTGLNGGKEA